MKLKAIIFLLALSLLIPVTVTKATTSSNLNGRILLQVESHGEAWYVNPKDGQRYYMADGNAAFNIMRTLSLGMANKDVERMKTDATYRQKFIGKILLQVESHGEAYYISPDGRYNYLKDGAAAYDIMTKTSLGVSDVNLNKITPNEIKTESQTPSPDLATTTDVNKIAPNEIKKESETKAPDLATTTDRNTVLPTEKKNNPDVPIQLQSKPETPIKPQPEVQIPTPTSTSTPITTIITVPTATPTATMTIQQRTTFALTNSSSCAYDQNFKCYSDSLCAYAKDKDVKGRCLLLTYYNFGYQKQCSLLNSEYPNVDCVLTSNLNSTTDRDIQTLYDVKKIQTLLRVYHDSNLYRQAYPGGIYNITRLFPIEKLPVATKGVSSVCSEDYNYKYTFFDSENYSLTYCLDSAVGALKAGINVVTPQSLQ